MPPDLPWPLQQRLWWFRQPQVPESVVAAGPIVAAHLVPSEFELADSAFNAITRTPDGSIYYGLSSHRADLDARLVRLEHGDTRAAVVATMEEPGGAVAHGKLHVPPAEWDGALYFATHVGVYRRQGRIERPATPAGFAPYPGGRILRVGLPGGPVRDIARAPDGEGVIAMAVDDERGISWALTWPGGRLLNVDLRSGALANHGPVFGAGESGRGRTWEQVGRDLAVDPRSGRVHWSRTDGEIGWMDVDGTRGVVTSRLEVDGVPTSWRRVVWHPGRQQFVGITTNGVLFTFDGEQITSGGGVSGFAEAMADRSGPRKTERHTRSAPATLAFHRDADRDEVHYLALGPGLFPRRTRHTVEAVTVSLHGHRTRHHGVLRLDDGRYVTFAQGLVTHGDEWFALAWIELPATSADPRIAQLRAWHRPHSQTQIHRLPKQVGLIRFSVNG
jgi:hypothetical protein